MIILKICQAARLQQITSRFSTLILKRHIYTTINRNEANRMNVISVTMALEKNSQRFRAKDKMTRDDLLVFKSSIGTAMTWAYRCSFFIFISLASGLRHLWVEDIEYPVQLGKWGKGKFIITNELSMWLLYSVAIIYNLFCCILIRKIAIRIWHHQAKNTYTIVFPSLIPNNIRQITVKPGDVQPRFRFTSMTLVRAVHYHNRTKYYIPENNFLTPIKYFEFIDEHS